MILLAMKRVLGGILIFALAAAAAPESLLLFAQPVEPVGPVWGDRSGGQRGGFVGAPRRPPEGARTRRMGGDRPRFTGPNRPRAGTRPDRPRFAPGMPHRPRAQQPYRPPRADRPPRDTGPRIIIRPGTRPPIVRQVPRTPDARRAPGMRRPPIIRVVPRVAQPQVTRKPPGWRPPRSRPPGWRPPLYRPPYYRPPHRYFGDYNWNPLWGWFFTAAIIGSTLAYVDALPAGQACTRFVDGGETLYLCGGIVYRSTYYSGRRVFEIVSDAPYRAQVEPQTVIGLKLTSPMMRGALVRDLQNRLVAAGYDVGGVDGIFGSATENALKWFQYDHDLQPTGIVDARTADALGY